tara:strand:- start:27 stop:1349 length:1323 start_codon:yes stop_codon:yes gene_type:complete
MSSLSKTLSSSGNRKIFTISVWVKRTKFASTGYIFGVGTASSDTGTFNMGFTSDDRLIIESGATTFRITSRKFTDPAGWYHIIVAVNTSLATQNDRIKVYINGVQETDFDTNSGPSQDLNGPVNESGKLQYIGLSGAAANSFKGYMAHFHLTDGTQYAASDFGQTDSNTQSWIPKSQPSVSYGTNGFFLKFEDGSNMGLDSSGQTNNYAVSLTGSNNDNGKTQDTPSNSFCVVNNFARNGNLSYQANGGLQIEETNTNQWQTILGTHAVSKGKWYWEVKLGATGDGQYFTFGWCRADIAYNSYVATNNQHPFRSTGYGYDRSGQKINNNSSSSYGSAMGSSSFVGVKMDLDNGTIGFTYNGADQGNAYTGITVDANKIFWVPAIAIGQADNGTDAQCYFNFGNPFKDAGSNADAAGYGQFEYAVPSGYYALCTKNIETYG